MWLSLPVAFIFGFAFATCCAHINFFLEFQRWTLSLVGKLPVMHHDPKEPETRKCNHGKLLKNWIFILLKRSSRLAQRSENCFTVQPKGGHGWGRSWCMLNWKDGTGEELWYRPRWGEDSTLREYCPASKLYRERTINKIVKYYWKGSLKKYSARDLFVSR